MDFCQPAHRNPGREIKDRYDIQQAEAGAEGSLAVGWEAWLPAPGPGESGECMFEVEKQLLCQEHKGLVGREMCVKRRCHLSPLILSQIKWLVIASAGEREKTDALTLYCWKCNCSFSEGTPEPLSENRREELCPSNPTSSTPCFRNTLKNG